LWNLDIVLAADEACTNHLSAAIFSTATPPVSVVTLQIACAANAFLPGMKVLSMEAAQIARYRDNAIMPNGAYTLRFTYTNVDPNTLLEVGFVAAEAFEVVRLIRN